jgi:hypothetical protein
MGNIALGINNITNLTLGTNPVNFVYLGANLVWTNYILNSYGSANHALSLRKLSGTYTGKCLRVRRTTSTPSVTTTTVDVSFDSNNVVSLNSTITYVSGTSTTAINLGQFCASVTNGYSNPDGVNTNQSIFVVTWFDQSGNGKNPTNATVSQQPRLVNLGNLETSGSKVAVRFTKSSNQNLNIVDTTANCSNMSSYVVAQYSGVATNNQIAYLWSNTQPSGRFYFPYYTGGATYAGYGGSIMSNPFEAFNTNRRLYVVTSPDISNPSVGSGYLNGVQTFQGLLGSGASTNIQLGTGLTNYFDGFIQEAIGYQSNANRVQKETNINNYWTIY